MSLQSAPRIGRYAYQQLRENVARVILLGLEVLIIADIVRTIVVEPSLESGLGDAYSLIHWPFASSAMERSTPANCSIASRWRRLP